MGSCHLIILWVVVEVDRIRVSHEGTFTGHGKDVQPKPQPSHRSERPFAWVAVPRTLTSRRSTRCIIAIVAMFTLRQRDCRRRLPDALQRLSNAVSCDEGNATVHIYSKSIIGHRVVELVLLKILRRVVDGPVAAKVPPQRPEHGPGFFWAALGRFQSRWRCVFRLSQTNTHRPEQS